MKWMNFYLKEKEIELKNLEIDLYSGVNLCYLMEVLTQKEIKNKNKSPKVKFHYIYNITLALEAMKEKFKTGSIGPIDFYEGDIKKTLPLFWKIVIFFILYYFFIFFYYFYFFFYFFYFFFFFLLKVFFLITINFFYFFYFI